MTRREKLVRIAMQQYSNHEVNLFVANMPKTILANDFTRDLAIFANAILLKAKSVSENDGEVLAIHNNLT
jgi:hypothetical protein